MIAMGKRHFCRRLSFKSATGCIAIGLYAVFVWIGFVNWNIVSIEHDPTIQLVHQVAMKHMQVQQKIGIGHVESKTGSEIEFPYEVTISSNDSMSAEFIASWMSKKTIFCNDNFVGYSRLFATIHDVELDPSFARGRRGGEDMNEVLNQKEEKEFLDLLPGYFRIKCQNQTEPHYFKDTSNHLTKWNSAVVNSPTRKSNFVYSNFTIAVKRYEYVNLYHTMTDIYNAFLMVLIFKISPQNTDILFIDSHPKGSLDSVWSTLFRRTIRAGHLTQPVVFSNLVWSIMGYNSPLNQHATPHIPYLEEFRQFFLSRFNVEDSHKLNCSNISLLIIWREDYVAHPRNPKGRVTRKIKNEIELAEAISDELRGHRVHALQIDLLPMREQLQLISETDILVGMHGAGLSHTLFLPKHAGLAEFYPIYYPQSNRHFLTMARWRHLHYNNWQNSDIKYEFSDHRTYIPPKTAVQMVHEIRHNLCGGHDD